MSYIVKTKTFREGQGVFEGPLDLLLELTEKNKLDITDISLSAVAEEFIDYMNEFGAVIDPKHLADFVLVAGKLLLIKSKAILPLLELEKEEEESIEDLKRQLREYRRFKEVFPWVSREFSDAKRLFAREAYAGERVSFSPPTHFSPLKLTDAYAALLTKTLAVREADEKVRLSQISLTDKMEKLKNRLLQRISITFHSTLQSGAGRMEVVVTFLAMLELVRKNQVMIDQAERFGEITIKKIRL